MLCHQHVIRCMVLVPVTPVIHTIVMRRYWMPSSSQWIVPCPACRQQHLVSGAQIRDRSWLTTPCQACQEAHPAPDASAAGDAASPPNPDAERDD